MAQHSRAISSSGIAVNTWLEIASEENHLKVTESHERSVVSAN